MGKTLGMDRSYDNGYEEGLVNGVALAGQALDAVLKQHVIAGGMTEDRADEIKKAVGVHIAEAPERARQQIKQEAVAGQEGGKDE